MKKLLVPLLVFVPAFVCFSEPLELGILREKRDVEIAKIDRQYLAALEKLKTKFTKAGNLKGALAVKAEIERKTPNRFLGKWKYEAFGLSHYREFTRTTCTLFSSGKKVWTRKYRLVSPTKAIVEDKEIHEIRNDGKLNISNEYVGERASSVPDPGR